MLAVCSLIINSVNYYLVDWVPLYLETTRGFSFSRGNFLSIVVYGGSFSGSVLIGLLVRWIVKLGYGIMSAKRSALFVSCVLMLSSIVAGLTSFRYLAVICLALTGIGVAGFLVIYLTLIQDLEPAHVGMTSGMLGGLSNIVYGYLSPYVGRLADHHNSSLVLVIAGLLPWLAFLAISPKMGAEQR
jgi:sugar phosphate permease